MFTTATEKKKKLQEPRDIKDFLCTYLSIISNLKRVYIRCSPRRSLGGTSNQSVRMGVYWEANMDLKPQALQI
jgi:hypothetical protein